MAGNLAQLQALFPQFDKDVLEGILHVTANSVDDAIDALLQMDTTEPRPHNPNDPDLHVGALQRASKRTVARRRLRQRKRSLKRHEDSKKIKWVRFNPFVTAIAKEPLKDAENTNIFNVLAEGDDDIESWEELAEKEKEIEPMEEMKPTYASIVLGSFLPVSFQPFVQKQEDAPACERTETSDSSEAHTEIEEVPVEKEEEKEACATLSLNNSLTSSQIQIENVVSVKFYLSDTDIRRLGLNKNDTSAFTKLSESYVNMTGKEASTFAPKYEDEENERVTVRSQEELEECIRVHESFIWPSQGQQRAAPILRLYL